MAQGATAASWTRSNVRIEPYIKLCSCKTAQISHLQMPRIAWNSAVVYILAVEENEKGGV